MVNIFSFNGLPSFPFYMKYSVNPGSISSFVMGRAGSEYGLPVAVYMKYSVNPGSISNFVVGRPRPE